MKLTTATLVVLCCAPFVGAQSSSFGVQKKNGQPEHPKVQIDSVGAAMAYEPGAVTIRGTDLGMVKLARIDGVVAPIVAQSDNALVIAPKPGEPGFGQLELFSPFGTLASTIELMPTVQVQAKDDVLRLTLRGGQPGPYWVFYSLDLRATPYVHPGMYYGSMLDMTARRSGLVAKGVSDGNPFTLAFPAPPGWTYPIHFQALCQYGAIDRDWSFSNAFSQSPFDVTGHPVRQGLRP